MSRISKTFVRFSLTTVLGGAAFLWSGQLTLAPTSSLVSSAEARIGRPLTPLSYAGVARRTTRRAVVGGAVAAGTVAAGAYYAAPVVVGPACSQVVDAYGRVVTVCR
jgi:subtilisin family serine protease